MTALNGSFLFCCPTGCDINKKDSFGRTPLHVSAAVDFVEMTEFLLLNNADIDSKTYVELQVPLHYAAKNGATRALKMLLSFHANIDALDAKKRTPLQVFFLFYFFIINSLFKKSLPLLNDIFRNKMREKLNCRDQPLLLKCSPLLKYMSYLSDTWHKSQKKTEGSEC